jgi:muramoyltetrapeptide carboxypeptidase
MIMPPALKKGDTIGITATARKISREELQTAIQLFEGVGLQVELAPNLFAINNQFAGTHQQKADDFNAMLANPQIKAIVCARGGYGTVHMVDLVNWDLLKQQPKWIVGYSDITVLHSHIQRSLGIATLHATMPLGMDTANTEKAEAQNSLCAAIMGTLPSFALPAHPLNRVGDAKGIISGGNLSVLYSILGSVSFPETDGKILFLEDLDEYLYHIDRMMMGLKRAGKLQNLAALIVGGMSDMRDNAVPFGKTAEEIIADVVAEYNYPVYFNFPAGHIDRNLALPLGLLGKMENGELVITTPN